jgi:hypothetical protein
MGKIYSTMQWKPWHLLHSLSIFSQQLKPVFIILKRIYDLYVCLCFRPAPPPAVRVAEGGGGELPRESVPQLDNDDNNRIFTRVDQITMGKFPVRHSAAQTGLLRPVFRFLFPFHPSSSCHFLFPSCFFSCLFLSLLLKLSLPFSYSFL